MTQKALPSRHQMSLPITRSLCGGRAGWRINSKTSQTVWQGCNFMSLCGCRCATILNYAPTMLKMHTQSVRAALLRLRGALFHIRGALLRFRGAVFYVRAPSPHFRVALPLVRVALLRVILPAQCWTSAQWQIQTRCRRFVLQIGQSLCTHHEERLRVLLLRWNSFDDWPISVKKCSIQVLLSRRMSPWSFVPVNI